VAKFVANSVADDIAGWTIVSAPDAPISIGFVKNTAARWWIMLLPVVVVELLPDELSWASSMTQRPNFGSAVEKTGSPISTGEARLVWN
jgi:hypothetical protein